jgi:bifunctional non-homologous end joining protein LigD
MALEEYAKKREFTQTPEPSADEGTPGPGTNVFCVQRHAARRLHYDFRIEVSGTMKSWAVPNGPSLDPGRKQLAVMVEDHPMLYATWEGNIPKGNYGAGSMMLWDAGNYELMGEGSAEQQIERGDFKFKLNGRKLQGNFALVRLRNAGKGNEWLMLKKKDEAAQPDWDIEQHAWSVKSGRSQEEIALDMPEREVRGEGPPATGAVAAPMPAMFTPMLAASSEKPPVGPGWIYEIKWDGVRALCFVQDGEAKFVGRRGTVMDRQYPELHEIPKFLRARSAVLDGEIAVLDEAGRANFGHIQPRIMASDSGAIEQLARSRPAIYFVFDLVYLNGYDLTRVPLEGRKRLLRSILRPGCGALRYSEEFDADPQQLLELARAQGLEGLLAKRTGSHYQTRRTGDWVKVKVALEQDFVIAGWTEGERDYFGALVLGAFEKGEFVHVGRVGSGFDSKVLAAVYAMVTPLENGVCPFRELPATETRAHWVRPELVCRVKYQMWTHEAKLRAPVFVGIRNDVLAEDCTLTPVEATPRAALIAGTRDEASVNVDGQAIRIKNLNKVLWPKEGYTKRDLINYYDSVADLLIPYWKDRPLSLRRYPDGIESEGFFQKNVDSNFPSWMRTEMVEEEGEEPRRRIVGNGRAELIYLANLGCIDQNPWMSRVGSIEYPDFLLVDLDPHECSYDKIVEAALMVKARLDLIGLRGYPKTTGGDGMHIYIPVEPVYTYPQTKAFAEILARLLASERPDLSTLPRAVGKRAGGKVYFDYLQNGLGKTISGPYVLRAHPGAPVATPLEWSELKPGLRPQNFNITNAAVRFSRVGDLFEGVLSRPQRLEAAIAKLDGLVKQRL